MSIQRYDQRQMESAHGSWVRYDDHEASLATLWDVVTELRKALAERDARIEVLERALRDVTDHFAAVMRAPHVKYDADPEKMPSIAEARAALAPAQESAESGSDDVLPYIGEFDRPEDAGRWRGKPMVETLSTVAGPCDLCGGSGIARYPEPDGGVYHERCPNGCAKPREEG